MKVRLYLIRSMYGHVDIEVDSIDEAEERFIHEDYDYDDIEIDVCLDGEWTLDEYATPDIIKEEED